MRLAAEYGIEPENMAMGAAAGMTYLLKAKGIGKVTKEMLSEELGGTFAENASPYDGKLINLTEKAFELLENL